MTVMLSFAIDTLFLLILSVCSFWAWTSKQSDCLIESLHITWLLLLQHDNKALVYNGRYIPNNNEELSGSKLSYKSRSYIVVN